MYWTRYTALNYGPRIYTAVVDETPVYSTTIFDEACRVAQHHDNGGYGRMIEGRPHQPHWYIGTDGRTARVESERSEVAVARLLAGAGPQHEYYGRPE